MSASPPSPPPGFLGVRTTVIASAQDGAHTVTLAWYTFPGSVELVPYVELSETHGGARPGRVMALSTLVHLAQNVGEDEVWTIGGRETPGGVSVEAQLAAARATIARLNRRAQQAESIIARSGVVASRPQGDKGRSLGRALANYAAARLADVAREAIEGWASAHFPAPPRRADAVTMARLRARLDALDGGGRATLPPMSLPTLTQLAAAGHAASTNSAGAWNALTGSERTAVEGRLRWTLDYVATTLNHTSGDGVIYAASPGSPPPTEPAP